MPKKYKVAYLSYLVIEAETEAEAQRKLIRHLDQCPGAVTGVYGRFVPLLEAWPIFCKLDGLPDDEIQKLMSRIGPSLVNPE